MFGHHNISGLRRYALLALVPLWASGARADDPGARAPVVVSAVKGDVHVTSGARDIPLKAGVALDLPVSIRVGAHGALEMHQGATVVSAAANSQLQIPKATSSDQTLDKIVQSQGNVYYSVAKRPAHKLRIETPLLVAVIKGTRFNVSALDTMTTISLLEGSIEVHASDDSSVVDLSAGQMATRSRSQPAIRIIRMSTGDVIGRPGHEVALAGAAAGQHESGASRFQEVSRGKDEATRSVPVVSSVAAPAEGQAATLASGVGTPQGDDHGASSSLTLNQLVTRANSSASVSAGGGPSTGGGASVDGGPSAGGGVSAGGGSVGTGSSSGSGAGTSSSPGGPSGTTASTGNSGSSSSGTGPASSGGSMHGNGNGGTTLSPGNSGITVTPGSSTGTSSPSNSGAASSSSGNSNSGPGNSSGQGSGGQGSGGSSSGPGNSNGQGPGNSLNAALQSLLNKKKK
jgi:collagen type III alpha